MPRLTKRERDALKASGEWKDVSITRSPLNGAFEFCRLASEANKEPVPNVPQHWSAQDQGQFRFTMDHEMIGEAAERFAQSGDFFEYKDEIFTNESERASPDGCFFDAMMSNLACRVVGTSGLTEVSESHSVPDVGATFQMAAYVDSVGAFDNGDVSASYTDAHALAKTLLWCAEHCVDTQSAMDAISRMWLPNSPNDGHSKHVLADRLAGLLRKHGVYIGVDSLVKSIYSGLVPKVVSDGVGRLPDDLQESVPKLFWTYKDGPHFHKFFGSLEFSRLLKAMNLEWKDPSPTHLCFNRSFRDLTISSEKRWENRKFLGGKPIVSSLRFRESRGGSPSQLIVRGNDDRECFSPGSVATPENIIEAHSFRLHSLVIGPELDLVSYKFNPFRPFEHFDYDEYLHVPLCVETSEDLTDGTETDDEMFD